MSAAAASGAHAAAEIAPQACIVVTPENPNAIVRFAAAELRKHLALLRGAEAGTSTHRQKFTIHVGERPACDVAPVAAEEARWRVTPEGIWLYGDDKITRPGANDIATATAYENHTGTLFAVYEFLERYCGVRWIDQGDDGIAFEPLAGFAVETASGSWKPALNQRHIRPCYRDIGDRDPDRLEVRPIVLSGGNIPYAFIMPTDEFQQRRVDEAIWHRRLRLGRSEPLSYGHAFTQWWFEYGKTHPEFFALNRNGKREPSLDIMQGMPERIKMCVSNPNLVREIVRRHFDDNGGPVVDACENDSRGFCRCDRCLALDVLEPGEERLDVDQRHLTDRYLHFVNAVQAEAKQRNPNVRTAFYAYSQYHFPPRREKVADGVIVFFITGQFASDEELTKQYQAWKDAGAKEVYLRPNHLCDDTGMPLGFEESMYEKFQLIRKTFPIAGTDYDCSWGFRPYSGIAEYIMARLFNQPDAPFADLENDYCAAFGPAREDIREYYRYWRQIWNKRIGPNRNRVQRLSGQIKEGRDRLMQLTDLLYAEEDFGATDALLARALRHDLTLRTRARIEQLQLANQHSRITYHARKANELLSMASADEKANATRALMAFRREHRDELNIYWEGMLYIENAYNDSAGLLRLTGRQPKRLADWGEQMAASMKKNRRENEPPVR